MKSLLVLLAAAVLVAPYAGALEVADPLAGVATDDAGRYIVAFYDAPTERKGDAYQGGTVVDTIDGLKMLVVDVDSFAAFEARVHQDDNARYVVSDVTDAGLHYVPNDYFYNHAAHWGSKRIGGEAAWDTTLGSTAVKVGMVDSGLNFGHEEWSGNPRVLTGYDFRFGDSNPADESGCDYHGTHTSGTAGAPINNGLGIAGMSQHMVLPIKIFGTGLCNTTNSAIINALQYAGDQGAHVSSNSWGGGAANSGIDDAIAYAHGLGTIHVASAGNSGPCSNCVGQPWKNNPAITIVVSSLTDGDTFSSFSSRGNEVDIIAPGEYVASSTSGTADYHAYSGTSMAAPHVAGAIGLYLTVNPGSSYSTVTSALASTAEDLGLSADRQGDGLVRADLLVGGTPPPPQCSDGIDNDGDGLTDYPADPGCTDANDNDEFNAPPPQCSDGIDNDGDGLTDFPADPGCTDANDDDEFNAPPGQDMHVDAMTGWSTHSGGNKHTLHCEVTIVDAGGAAVSGATVTVDITKPNGRSSTASGATDGTGTVELTVNSNKKHGTGGCDVTDVTKSGWTYDSAANTVTSITFSAT